MEEELVRILRRTLDPRPDERQSAEWQLKNLNSNPDFPLGLITVGSHGDVPIEIRQSALLYLKTFVLASWSDQLEEFGGQLYVDENKKIAIRQRLLELTLSERDERRIKGAAGLVVSKIATVDFPDRWPDLLPSVLNVVATGTDEQLHGALKLLLELIDDSLTEQQFLQIAHDLVKKVYDVAANENRKSILRALAVSVFRSCFDTLEMMMADHSAAVKSFVDDNVKLWMGFFGKTLENELPHNDTSGDSVVVEHYRGCVALKLQVVKVLMRIRTLFPQIISPMTPGLFSAIWQELSRLQSTYHAMYIEADQQGRLEDADGLPYTLDFLVLEELDFMQACIRAPPVRKELLEQLQNRDPGSSWIAEVMRIAVAYAQITNEEEDMWGIDTNIFLSEEVNVTANYTPRTACGDLVIKLGEWLNSATVEGLLAHTRTLYAENASWKAKEAGLYLFSQLLGDFQDVEKQIGPEAANGYVELIKHAMQESDEFLRARGFLVAGSLTRTSGDTLQPMAASFMETSLNAITNDSSEVVKVSCIRALQYYLTALPPSTTISRQSAIVAALHDFFATLDDAELDDRDDLVITMIETLRDTILLDAQGSLINGGMDLFMKFACRGANNFQIVLLATEAFEEITEKMTSGGADAYAHFTQKVMPTLTSSFDVASLTEENALANLAAELLSVMIDNGTSPLPQGFVATILPRLNRLLLNSQDDELLKAATAAVKHMLSHDPEQVFSTRDQAGKEGLEVILIIIDRLLSPAVEDTAAEEVGGLAAEVVEKAGAERLGPYLTQLLQVVAARVATASKAQLIQSLILVFARLSLISAQEVVGFLADVRIGNDSGLQVVISKWLENSINFAGYEDIRQNVVALAKLYQLQDPRLMAMQVKGDMIIPESNRIMTRSRAKQNPEQYTVVSAQFKIIKVLVEELLSASGKSGAELGNPTAGLEAGELDDDEEEDWEDEDNDFLDLGTGLSKAQLMSYAAEDNIAVRGRDDETQAFLLSFFHEEAQKPGFGDVFAALTPDEQQKLHSMSER